MPDFTLSAPAFRALDQPVEDNLGGVMALWYTRAADILNWPVGGPLLIEQTLELRAGASWYQVVAVRGSVRYKQTSKQQGRHGQLYQQKLTGSLARHTAGLAAGLDALEGQKLVFIYRDLNGQVQLVGSPECGLDWQEGYDSGSPSQLNGYDFTAAGDALRARPYTGAWTVSGQQGPETGLELQDGGGGTVVLRTSDGRVLARVPAGKSIVLKSGFKLNYFIV